MSKFKKQKYIVLLGISLLVVALIGLFSIANFDKYKGKIKVKNVVSNSRVLSASIANTIDQPNTSKGSDEIKYEIRYTLDQVTGVDKRDVIVKATLTDDEVRYAKFKRIKGTNISSNITNNGKEIEIEIKDSPLGVENLIVLKLIITNAPNGFKVNPNITIKEKTNSEVTTVTTSEIEVNTTMVSGRVLDENNLPVGNIELSLNDSHGEIRRTYTDENGNYVFSDVENGTYRVDVEEEIYELIGNNTIENEGILNLTVKEVSPYEIEGHKYITKLHLIVNGKAEDYTYDDLEKVVQNVKNAKTISGEITYKITVKNVGEKTGKISMLKDKVEDGLSFDSNKNAGWKEKKGKLYYEPIADVSIKPGETRVVGLKLDIKNTDQIKTYINQIDINGEIFEKVVYILNGEKYREEEVILGEKIGKLEILDDSFSGWYTDSNYTNEYNFNNEVTKDLILYGKTEIIKHKIEFYDKNPETGVESFWDEQEVIDGRKATEPAEPSHTGYDYACWMDEHDVVWNFDNPVTRDMKLTSCYTIKQYTVKFIDGQEPAYDTQTVNYKGSITVPANPGKQYYTFNYWHLNGVDSAYDLTIPVTEDITLYSKYTRNKHTVTFVDKDPVTLENRSTEEVQVNEGEAVVPPQDPSRTGFDFICWTKPDNSCYDFSTLVTEELTLTSSYGVVIYKIDYDGLTEAEKTAINNPKEYTILDDIDLNNPPTRKDNDGDDSEYFSGWTGTDVPSVSTAVNIPVGSTGNRSFTAHWTAVTPTSYPISYELHGGDLGKDEHGDDITNPSSYTKKSNPITLHNPSKTAYTFTGWTGTDVANPTLEVTIPTGSRGPRTFEAHYTPVDYTIDYENSCGTISVANPTTYNVESNPITLNNPSKTGYTFTGWKLEGSDEKVMNVTIPTGSYGNKKYIATCEPIEYTITYHLEGGSLETGKTNPETYTVDSPAITLNNPTKDHHNFAGWTGTDITTPETTVVIPSGSTGDREYTATYQMITHNVIFNDYDVETPTPESVTQYGETVVVNDGAKVAKPENNPEHTGYICNKWSTTMNGNYDTDAYDFSTPVTTDLVLYNLCKKRTFRVTYKDGTQTLFYEDVLYKEHATVPTNNPTKAHNIFLKWVKEDGTPYDFTNEVVTEDITLYASWEEVEPPAVSHAPTDWTNQNVTLTITNQGTDGKDYTGYTYKYRIDEGSPIDYVDPDSIEENCDIYAVAYKNGIPSEEVKHEIRNIDKIDPTIDSFNSSEIESTGFKINMTGHDNESGLHEFRIYKDDTYVTSVVYDADLNDTKTSSYEFTGLQQDTVYTIKIVAVDVAGNTTESEEIEVQTLEEERIVAQIISYNGTELDEYIELSSLRKGITYNKDGINCNTGACVIQMLDNVTETNDILDGQDITLDLNGFTVNGLNDYTFTNNGTFKVIDSKVSQAEQKPLMIDYIKGLKATDTSLVTDDTAVASLRYTGANPNNYVKFNNELWRIVGVMNGVKTDPNSSETSTRLKLVRANSIGNYSWDSSLVSVNRGTGVNEWSQSDLMKMLNPGFEEETVGESLYYNSGSGTCYYNSSNGSTVCNFSSTGLSEEAKSMIEPVVWGTGAVPTNLTSSVSRSELYKMENQYGYTGRNCSSGTYCNDSVPRSNNWYGYVGIPSASDYGYATSSTNSYCSQTMSANTWSNNCSSSDWLRGTKWLLNPQQNSSYASYAYYINTSTLASTTASVSRAVYPSVYLDASLLYKSGSGTSTDPFVMMTETEYQNELAKLTNGIKNSTDIAIINNGTLTLGNIEATDDVVLQTNPYVEGNRFGVKNNNTFNFYDGKIKGTVAIDGEVTDTPYPCNAVVNVVKDDDETKQIAFLKVITDPEARINNVYYTKVQKAFDDAKRGEYVDVDTPTTFTDTIAANSNGFVYDEINERFVATSSANTNFIVDLSEYTEDQELNITTTLEKLGDRVDIEIRKDSSTGTLVSSKSRTDEGTMKNSFYLEKGSRYYVSIAYTSYSSDDYKMYIEKVSLSDYTYSTNELIDKINLQSDYSNYTFEYDSEEKVIKSNNTNITGSNAFAYFEVDLTNETKNKDIIINATMYTNYNSNYGNIVINEDNSKLQYSTSNAFMYFQAPSNGMQDYIIGPNNATKTLEAGKKYYVQFYYFKDSGPNNATKDGLYINSIRIVDSVVSSAIDLDGSQIVTEDPDAIQKSNCSSTSYQACSTSNATDDSVRHSYMEVDLTNSTEDKTFEYNYNYSVNASSDYYFVVTDSPEMPSSDDGAFFSIKNRSVAKYVPAGLEKGKKHYIHFVLKGQGYLNLYSMKLTSGRQIDLSTMDTPATNGWKFNQSGSSSYIYPQYDGSKPARAYYPIDLTNITSDVYAEISLDAYGSLGIINSTTNTEYQVLDKNVFDYLKTDTNSESKIFNVQLKKGQMNYLQFYSEYNGSSVKINYIRLKNGISYDVSNLKKSGQYGYDYYYSYDKIYRSNNYSQYNDSYVKVDLKDATSDKLLRIEARNYYSDSYIYISTNKYNNDFTNFDSNRDKMVFAYRYSMNENIQTNNSSSDSNPRYYDVVLQKGATYYVHFGYKSNYSSYSFGIKSIVAYDLESSYARIGTNKAVTPAATPDINTRKDIDIDVNQNNSFRYIGASPKNYISFNNELWRIVGVFETEDENGNVDRRIKIVRNQSIGNYSWDTTPGSIMGGNGINAWNQADIMKVLNPGYDNNKETFYDSDTSTSIEDKVNNSLYWNKDSGVCFVGGGNYIGGGYSNKNCNFSSIGLSAEAKSYIDTVKWHTTTAYPNRNNVAAIYADEMTDAPIDFSSADSIPRTSPWVGKVGLLYVSDVFYAQGGTEGTSYDRQYCLNSTSPSSYCYSSNWIINNSNNYIWTISSSTAPYYSVYMSGSGYYNTYSYNTYGIRPTVYLSPKVELSGSGTSVDPYTISMGSEKNPKTNFGLDESTEQDDSSSDVAFVTDTESFDTDIIKASKIYDFKYESETDEFVNNNVGKEASVAVSYTTIDLTNETNDMTIVVYANSSTNLNDYGYVNIFKDNRITLSYDSASSYGNGLLLRQSGIHSDRLEYTLEAGHLYYIQFGYKKTTSQAVTDTIKDEFRVKVVSKDKTEEKIDFTRYDGIAPDLNHEVDTVHILKDIALTQAINVIDTQKVILDLNGYDITTNGGGYLVDNAGDLTVIDSKYDSTQTLHRIYGTNNTVFNNQNKAHLDLQQVKVTTTGTGVINRGTFKMDAPSIIDVGNIGIANEETGDILNGTGTIRVDNTCNYFNEVSYISSYCDKTIQNRSNVETGFSNYTLENGVLYDTKEKKLTLDNISNPTGFIYATKTLELTNSNFKGVYLYGSSDSKIYGTNTIGSNGLVITGADLTDDHANLVSGLTVGNISNRGTTKVINSTVSSLGSTGLTTIEDSTITNLTISNKTTTVKGTSTITSVEGGHATAQTTLIFGDKDGTYNEDYPVVTNGITGKTARTYIPIDMKFYDGHVTGPINKAITATISDKEEGYQVISEISGSTETDKLSNKGVCKIGNTPYNSLKEAVEAAGENSEVLIEVTDNIRNTDELVIPLNKNIVVDYKGFSVINYSPVFFTNNGTLKVTDTSGSPQLNDHNTTRFIENYGTFTYELANNQAYNGMHNNENATMIINSGTISYLSITNDGILTVNNGTFNYQGYGGGIVTTETGKATINDGIFIQGSITNYNITNVNGGIYKQIESPIFNNAAGTMTVTNVDNTKDENNQDIITGRLYYNHGTLIFDSSKFNGISYQTIDQGNTTFISCVLTMSPSTTGTFMSNKDTSGVENPSITVKDSTIVVNSSTSDGSAFSAINGGTINIEGFSSITGKGTIIRVFAGGTANVKSGTLTTTNGYGVYMAANSTNNSTVNIGEKINEQGGTIDKNNPLITGVTGIYNSNQYGILNIYDGTITGKTNQSVVGPKNEYEVDSTLITVDNGNNTESSYLSQGTLVINTTKEPNVEYTNLQTAINEADSGDELVFVRNFYPLTSDPGYTVGADKNIILNIAGHTIQHNSVSNPLITNNGTLKIISTVNDNVVDGNIRSYVSSNTIENNGNLTIGELELYKMNGTNSIVNNEVRDPITNDLTSTVTLNNTYFDGENDGRVAVENSGILNLNNVTTFYTTTEHKNSTINNYGVMNVNCGIYSTINNTGSVEFKETLTGKTMNVYKTYTSNGGDTVLEGGHILNGNYSDGSTITVKDGSVDGNILLKDTSQAIIKGGNVSTISSQSENSVVTLGTKDGIIDSTSPTLRSIKIDGTLNFYDGVVSEGKSMTSHSNGDTRSKVGLTSYQPVYSRVTNVEDNSALVVDMTSENNAYRFIEYLVSEKVVENNSTNEKYYSLKDAFDAASSNDVINVIKDGYVSVDTAEIPAGSKYTLNLNGKTIYTNKEDSIVNNGTFDITDNSNGRGLIVSNIGSWSDIDYIKVRDSIKNNGTMNINGNVVINSTITNNENHTVNLTQGLVNNGVINKGTFVVDGGSMFTEDDSMVCTDIEHYDYIAFIYNTGTFTLDSGELYNNNIENFIHNAGTFITNGGSIVNDNAYGNKHYPAIVNNGNTTINNVDYSGGFNFITSPSTNSNLNNNRAITINGGLIKPTKSSGYIIVGSFKNVTVKNATFELNGATSGQIFNISANSSISDLTTPMCLGSFNNTTTISNVESSCSDINITVDGSTTIKDSSIIQSTGETAVKILENGTLTLGSDDSSVSTSEPQIISSSSYGILNTLGGQFKFFDGIITSVSNPLYGRLTSTPTGYGVITTVSGGTKSSTLKLEADIQKVAVVNNINYPDLPSALTACPTDGSSCTITIYTNITLDEAVTVNDGQNIVIEPNGFTIEPEEYITNHSGSGTIVINKPPEQVGGKIYRFLANITGTDINPRDIIIYQMEDGTSLNPATNYKLYKLSKGEYKLLKVNENRIGDYNLGDETDTLRTTKGQININKLEEGTYKLVGSDAKEIEFYINDTGISSNIRENKYGSRFKTNVTAIATLILTLQTGVIRHPYIVVISILIAIILGIMVYNKNHELDEVKEDYEN